MPICGWRGTEEAVLILCQKREALQTWVLNNGRNPHLLPRGQRRAFWITGCTQMHGVTEFCGRFEILYSSGHMDLYISGQGQGVRGEGQSRTTHHGGPAALCLSLGLYVESQEESLRVLGSKRHRQINTQGKTPVSAKT